jgi:hypothetical protein
MADGFVLTLAVSWKYLDAPREILRVTVLKQSPEDAIVTAMDTGQCWDTFIITCK